MITPTVFNRVFYLKCGSRRGASFALDVENRQYLITATHILRELAKGIVVELFHGGKWKPLDTAVVGYGPPQVDVAVLACKFRITHPEFPLVPLSGGLSVGQEAFCLGFPYGERGGGQALSQQFPDPFVKRVTVSHVSSLSSAVGCVYLDGQPNPGFSGGPVIWREENPGKGGTEEGRMADMNVGAVVSTFHYEQEPVYVGSDQLYLSAQHNPDLIVSYDIKHALDLINLNPAGFPLGD